ncbi:MAG: hypothetical protein Q9170_000981 [Blastenia crenularia]
MRAFHPRYMALAALSISVTLIPQLLALDPENATLNLNTTQQAEADHPQTSTILQSILLGLKPRILKQRLRQVQVQPRSPAETPPTEYLPYPPPPDYVWPSGPHTQYPPPSETNAPAGWYGGTGTGGQGNSGAGSAYGSSSGSSSSAAPALRMPAPFLTMPIKTLMLFVPSSFSSSPQVRSSSLTSTLERRQKAANRALQARNPVETPPTEYLPYPPPPNYQWPAGETPQNENPQPSENDPPPGWYTGETGGQGSGGGGGNNPNPNADGANAGSGAASQCPQQSGAVSGGRGWGKGHVAWVVIVSIMSTALVVGVYAYRKGKKGAGAGGDAEKGAAMKAMAGKMKFWKGLGGKKGKRPPPAADGGAAEEAGAPPAEE